MNRLVQVNVYEIVTKAINWHVIFQQLSTYLPEFTQFFQLMNLQNNLCKNVHNPTNNQLSYFGLTGE